MTKPTMAFLGTGIMGFQQAKRILQAGYTLHAWNRSMEKAKPLEEFGGEISQTPIAAVQGADIVIMMLADGPVSDEVLFNQGVADALAPGALVINMASIPVETARKQAEKLTSTGVGYLDAPVSGGEKGAIEGTLAIMVGGLDADFNRALDVFSVMGRAVLVGGHGTGELAKLCNQLIVGNTITTVAEAILLAQRGGMNASKLCDALKGGFADSPILQQHGSRMISNNFTPGGRAVLQLKDTGTARNLAQSLGLELPLLECVTELYRAHVEDHDGGETDHAGIYLELARRNNIKQENKS